jgi:formyl-CoA transferase
VVVENFRPGTLDGWGLGYEQVRAVRADVVYVSISGFGQFGPESPRVGYDPVAQAASGWLSLNGEPDGPPVKSPTFLGDDLGGVHGAIGALAALRHRDRTGEGQHVDVSLLDALLYQSNGYPSLGALGVPMPRLGSAFQVAAPAGVFPCGDGYVMAGVMLDAQWRALAGLVGRPDLAGHPDWATTAARVARRDEANALLAAWLAPRDPDETAALLNRHGLPGQRVRSYADAARDPHVHERDMLQPTKLEDGSTAPIVGPSWKLSRTPVSVRSGAPALGAHTDLVLAEIGMDPDTIRRLRDAGVL